MEHDIQKDFEDSNDLCRMEALRICNVLIKKNYFKIIDKENTLTMIEMTIESLANKIQGIRLMERISNESVPTKIISQVMKGTIFHTAKIIHAINNIHLNFEDEIKEEDGNLLYGFILTEDLIGKEILETARFFAFDYK